MPPLKKNRAKAAPRSKVQPALQVRPLLEALVVTAVFLAVASFGLWHHEMWRDEHQAWLVARDAHSLPELFANMKYEGNPALWHLLLFGITRFTHNPIFMQVLHLFIAGGFIFVFNRYCEMKLLYKVLFSFGYLPLYEYAVISRGYGLGLLLIFIACALFKNRSSHYLVIFVVLGLLANVTIYGLIISLGLVGILILDYFLTRKKGDNLSRAFLTGVGIYLFLAAVAILQIMPDKNNSFPAQIAETWFEGWRWSYILSRLFTTYFYMPDPHGMHFWNSNVFFDNAAFDEAPNRWQWVIQHPPIILVFAFLPLPTFLLGLLLFLNRPLILLLYAGVTLLLLAAFYYTLLVHMRYCGHLLVILIVCVWLSAYFPAHAYRKGLLRSLANAGGRLQKPLLASILLFHIGAATIAYAKDFKYEFSASKEVADFIRQEKLETLDIAGMTDFTISPLATYLNKKIFYLQSLEWGSFTRWNKQRRNVLKWREVLDALAVSMQGRTRMLLVMSQPVKITTDGKTYKPIDRYRIAENRKVDFLRFFPAQIVHDEKYYLYLAQTVDPAKENLKDYPLLRSK